MQTALRPLEAPRRADGVFEQLRAHILAGDYAPGERLPNERDLAEQLAVNRASVREAVKRLEFLELVEVRHGLGTFVRELGDSAALQVIESLLREPRRITRDLLAQLLVFRRNITLEVVALAAEHRTEEQLARGRALLERERAQARDPGESLAIDVELNRLLGEATHNLLYQLVTNLFSRLIRRLGPIYYNESRDHRRSLETHRELLTALEAGDPEAAREIVGGMLAYSETAILAEAERLEREGLIGPEAGGGVLP
ncbi:MAG: FadR/GntR family transcriptional regulator [Myxococcota bacterium]|nr:FadR/GntR family transcriptional regulator [Myxococcota bacterium]